MLIKALIFDFGETLISTRKFNNETCFHVLQKSLQNQGVLVTFEKLFETYKIFRRRFFADIAQTFEEESFAKRIATVLQQFDYYFKENDPIVQDTVNAFKEAIVHEALQKFNIKQYFNAVRVSDDIGWRS
jgi:FMN phosphatase YigB (HAD superfamily)